jgi:hypothetical protein
VRRRTPNYRKLARSQRWLLWLVLGEVLLHLALLTVVAGFSPPVGAGSAAYPLIVSLFWVVVMLAMTVVVVLVLHAEDNNIVIIALGALLMIAPCANLVVLLLVNMSATRTLRRAGIRVGFMGADAEDVERAVNPDLCKGCSYNLTGNVSGVCPECGRPTYA